MIVKARMTEEICSGCKKQMNSWDVRLTKKFKVRNTCETCFCEIYGLSRTAFRERMLDYFGERPCQGL